MRYNRSVDIDLEVKPMRSGFNEFFVDPEGTIPAKIGDRVGLIRQTYPVPMELQQREVSRRPLLVVGKYGLPVVQFDAQPDADGDIANSDSMNQR